jgi:oxysterol-binding protein-related protein 8
MDLSKVTFPTFVLEPRSMLERITDFMSHPDLIFGQVDLSHVFAISCQCSPTFQGRELRRSRGAFHARIVVLSSWLAHKAKRREEAVRNPYPYVDFPLNIHYRYNPILGEFFRCRYDYSNGTQGFYIAEQGRFAFGYVMRPTNKWYMQSLIILLSPHSSTFLLQTA